jgi:hypothetical protein
MKTIILLISNTVYNEKQQKILTCVGFERMTVYLWRVTEILLSILDYKLAKPKYNTKNTRVVALEVRAKGKQAFWVCPERLALYSVSRLKCD